MAAVLDRLRRHRILAALPLLEATSVIAPKSADADSFVEALYERGWITSYQRQALMRRDQLLSLSHYQLLERLGSGGVSHVYKVRDTRTNRLAALKVLHEDAQTNPETLARFEREITVATHLVHPNIVQAIDADIAAGKVAYLAMEFLPGIDLSHVLIQATRVALQPACVYIAQAALGLQHAHENGLIHRDIKPANLLVTVPDSPTAPTAAEVAQSSDGKVLKILDLGLARTQRSSQSDVGMSVTGHGTLLGTPDYMAPEQGRDPRGVDIRADIYSLGCTFFHLLTGKVPFDGGNVMQKLFRHVSEPPPRVERYLPNVPKPLADLVAWMITKTPAERPPQPWIVAKRLQALGLIDSLPIPNLT
ncbi:serine/threonine-protein kinase [Tuwongella immobilis]|uniref:Protein kinase domain-containing protein n=1 Tax=Tuwongella immobilis TaxID=692036 RepID=A0A6C2YIH8_9BACT|nr:serine/threonine-protein kinase [Tuwongella immobilis]VIP00943.1 serine threonine protein kinase : Serine/threonine protein kinase OS=Rhodopirellula baltica WH47 GN=RBWH47_05978 PE=3 SV=1: Pkinase [Tuwongella immobilis]VTR97304.1 serine threonine protein kinase : Serine/threonine protein kinase OS=Rhodopirellula baltica WH47 GN=RBWH47_05978 PE=3 SV=1: Pkinase [Tuwongella immobilis]